MMQQSSKLTKFVRVWFSPFLAIPSLERPSKVWKRAFPMIWLGSCVRAYGGKSFSRKGRATKIQRSFSRFLALMRQESRRYLGGNCHMAPESQILETWDLRLAKDEQPPKSPVHDAVASHLHSLSIMEAQPSTNVSDPEAYSFRRWKRAPKRATWRVLGGSPSRVSIAHTAQPIVPQLSLKAVSAMQLAFQCWAP